MSNLHEDTMADASREEIMSALFANMVLQHTNMAFMCLGRVPNPETGKVMQDYESAKFFIDQLEMLEVKTKGNLDKREEGLLKQSLTNLRMAFVEAIEKESKAPPQKTEPAHPPEAKPSEAAKPSIAPETEVKAKEEGHKKFTKKY